MRSLASRPLGTPPQAATAHRATRRPRVWAEAGTGHGSLKGAGPVAGWAGRAGRTLGMGRVGTGPRGWALGGMVMAVRAGGLVRPVRSCVWCRCGLWRMAWWAGLGLGISNVQDAHDRQNGLWVKGSGYVLALMIVWWFVVAVRTCCKGTLDQVRRRSTWRVGPGGNRHAPRVQCAVSLLCLVLGRAGLREEGRVGRQGRDWDYGIVLDVDMCGPQFSERYVFLVWPSGSSCRIIGDGGVQG